MLRLDHLAVATAMLLLVQTVSADDELRSELSRCATLSGDTERLACYDELGARANKTPRVPVSAAFANTPGTEPADSFGAESLPNNKDDNEDPNAATAHVTRCVKDANTKYRFYLEGGQVWKQVSDKRLSFRECDFGVTIRRDFFGYKMHVDGKKVSTRVRRVR